VAGEGSTFFLSPQGDTGGTVVGLRRIYHLAFLLKKTRLGCGLVIQKGSRSDPKR